MVIAPETLTCHVAPLDAMLNEIVELVAHAATRPVRPLHLQALLNLPRCADSEGVVRLAVVEPLLTQMANELPPAAEWYVPDAGVSPRLLRFHPLDDETASHITRRFHYLHSARTDGRSYGLSTHTGRLVALCVSSPTDVASLQVLLDGAGRPWRSARVISRVFAFEGAPRNVISYMLSRAAREERRLGVSDLVTYVNPNVGFTGSSYVASGWHLLGTEPGTKYQYLDERYITARELDAQFRSHDEATLQARLGHRYAVSVMPLLPLLVFHTRLA